MKELRRRTLQLTAQYSLIFFVFVWLLSGGIYLWVDNSLGEGYINRINNTIEQQYGSKAHQTELSDTAAGVAADVTLDRLRNILLVVNMVALVGVPLVAHWISKRSLLSLVESQEAQRQFVAHASHELRTPLAVMSGELELAMKRLRTTQEYQRTIAAAHGETQRLATLVHELLLLARVQDSSSKLKMEAVSLDHAVEELVLSFQAKAQQKKLHLNLTIPSDQTITVKGKRDLLLVALGNVIDNAVKFAAPHTAIAIRLAAIGHKAVVSVEDSGKAIDKDKLTRIFDRFYQTDASHTETGAGLGLSITKQIIDVHHGSIAVTSRGTQTVFTIKLPLA